MLPYLDAGKKIPSYGLMIMLGIAVAFALCLFFNTHSPIKRIDRLYAACFALIGGILGAKLLAIAISAKDIIKYNIPLVDIIKNGFVFYGGAIGGACGLIIYSAIYKLNTIDFFDFAAVCLPPAQALGRIGCFLAGCCYGRKTDSFLGVVYHVSADPHTPLGVPLLPTQLFESAYCTLIFIVLIILSRKKRARGLLASVYMLCYAACRFINEFFRADERGFLWIFSTSQIISICAATCTLALIIIKKRGKRKKEL